MKILSKMKELNIFEHLRGWVGSGSTVTPRSAKNSRKPNKTE